ncbi:MAG: radical SAM family heme chaperone HemW [Deinococcales bacterium]
MISHLYVHVPFCPSICPYCDFHVLERRGTLVRDYLHELERDAAALVAEHGAHPLKTIYIGGGTPSFLRNSELETLVCIIQKHFGWAADVTLEVNPGTVSKSRAQHWKNLGVSRVSVGVQSTQDAVLRFLGRTHNSRQALEALRLLQEAGFAVSADLITAVSGQDLAQDIHTLGKLGLEHVSCYTLTIEPDTPFFRQGIQVREEDESAALEQAEPLLLQYGLERYEVSNHAKPGAEAQHNLAYWQNKFFYGLGAGAAGHYPAPKASDECIATRRTNPHLRAWLQGQRGKPEPISRVEFVTDALFNGLRLKRGINIAELSKQAGLAAREYFAPAFTRCEQRDWLEWEGDVLRCTTAGWWVLNRVIGEFLLEHEL